MAPKKNKPKGSLISRIRKGDKRALEIARSSPGLRSKLPEQYLTPEQRATRGRHAEKARLNAPEGPLLPRTLADINRDAGNAADLRYGGAERELQGLQRVSNVQGGRIDTYFDQYKQGISQAAAQTQAYHQGAADATRQAAAQTLQADNQQRTAMDAQQQTDAASRGATAAPSTAGQQAGIVRKGIADSYAAQIGGIGASRAGYMQQQAANTGLQKIEAQTDEDARYRGYGKQLTDIAGEKGKFASEYRTKGVDDERKFALETKAFNLDVGEAQAKVGEADQKFLQEMGVTRDEWNAMTPAERLRWQKKLTGAKSSPKGPKAPGEPKYGIDAKAWAKMTPAQRRKAKVEWEAAGKPPVADPAKDKKDTRIKDKRAKTVTYVKNIEQQVGWLRTRGKDDPFGPAVRDAMLKNNVPGAAADAAIFIYNFRKRFPDRPVVLPPSIIKALKADGIYIPNKWRPRPGGSGGQLPDASGTASPGLG